MAHDREFQRKRKDTRMPVRDSHGEDQPAARQTEQDFDLRRARDTPSSVNGKTHRQDIPVQTEFSHLSPETPASLLEQGEAYATALDGFSEHFETPDATRTAPPIQDNVRSNFRQEASRRSFVTEDVTDHDTGKYAPSSEGSAPPNGTDRSGQEHRYRTHQHGNKYQQRFQEAAQAEEQAAQKEKGMDSEPPKTSKLEFTADELPPETKDKKLTHARRKAERTAQKAEQAQNRLPARKKLRMETVSDPETGKAKKHLKFEKEVKSQKAHVKGPVPLRPVKAGANTAIGYAHKKIYEAEDENVGIKAAHRSELVGEAGLRTAYHRHKTAPYRKAAKLQQKSAKANARLAYRQALSDHPELKKHAIARIWQKQKLKRQYAKAAREAGKQAKNAAVATERVSVGIVHAVKRHPVICLVLLLLLLVIFLITSLFSTFSNIGTGGLGSLAASTYLADDQDINQAELTYTEWETDLQMEIDRVESDRPGYDEYRFDLDEIKHDPYVLTSILSALHNGVFTLGEVQGDLAMLFEKQYILTQTIETETRYRTETRTDSEGNTYTVEVPYTYYICNVKLENFDLSHLPIYILTEEQMGFYAAYMQTLGNRPDLFPNGSYPHASTPKEPTYYEIPPEALKDEAFAAMIAEAEKYVGYPYVWGGSSPSTSFDCSGFISWVINHSGWNVGRQTAQGLYNICTPVSPEQAKPGDLVFFVGTYDTAGMSHVGLYVGNSVMLHCGDPISYTNLNSSYWQQHFYCYGRLP